MKYKTAGRKTQSILLTLIFILLLCPITVFAKGSKTVKVGVYPLEGFHSFDQDGRCKGYDADYLTKIAGYTDWNYQFVRADSWSQAIEMLREGQIDLLSPSQITSVRMDEFNFSTFPIGKVYAAILALKDNPVIYEDYAKLHGFTPNIKFWDNHELLVNARHEGQVDAIVAN